MATAPKPGIGKRVEMNDDAKAVFEIRVGDDVVMLAINNVSMAEQDQVARQCGHSYESIFTMPGQIMYAKLWWLGRRASGEKNLTWAQAMQEWPEGLEADDLDMVEVNTEDGVTDPEA